MYFPYSGFETIAEVRSKELARLAADSQRQGTFRAGTQSIWQHLRQRASTLLITLGLRLQQRPETLS